MNRAAHLSPSRDDLIALTLAPHAHIETQTRQISRLIAPIGPCVTLVSKVPYWKLQNFNALQPIFGAVQNLGGIRMEAI